MFLLIISTFREQMKYDAQRFLLDLCYNFRLFSGLFSASLKKSLQSACFVTTMTQIQIQTFITTSYYLLLWKKHHFNIKKKSETTAIELEALSNGYS